MSGTLNKVMLIGHLGDEVKMHYFEGGGCVGNFPLATNETYTNRTTGEKVSNTEWHNIVAFGKVAEIIGEYLSKGSKVYIEGKLQTRSWDDKDGNKKYTTEIVVRELKMLGGGNTAESAGRPAKQEKPKPEPNQTYDPDSVPF